MAIRKFFEKQLTEKNPVNINNKSLLGCRYYDGSRISVGDIVLSAFIYQYDGYYLCRFLKETHLKYFDIDINNGVNDYSPTIILKNYKSKSKKL